jgi:hypothetical protein
MLILFDLESDIGVGAAPMSPVRVAAGNGRSFGRSLSLNVEVDEGSSSDWDCGSAGDGGEVLVSACCVFFYFVSF